MGKRFKDKKVVDNIVEEAIVGDTIVGDNFGISNEIVVSKSVVVPKAIVDTIVDETNDEIDSVAVGMSGVILEACVGAMKGDNLEGKWKCGKSAVDSNTQNPKDPELKKAAFALE
nr:hypothetical protein [Tanacetum cinerariifolium]